MKINFFIQKGRRGLWCFSTENACATFLFLYAKRRNQTESNSEWATTSPLNFYFSTLNDHIFSSVVHGSFPKIRIFTEATHSTNTIFFVDLFPAEDQSSQNPIFLATLLAREGTRDDVVFPLRKESPLFYFCIRNREIIPYKTLSGQRHQLFTITFFSCVVNGSFPKIRAITETTHTSLPDYYCRVSFWGGARLYLGLFICRGRPSYIVAGVLARVLLPSLPPSLPLVLCDHHRHTPCTGVKLSAPWKPSPGWPKSKLTRTCPQTKKLKTAK